MSEELPREVSRGTMRFGDFEVEVVHLDNGQRLVTEEGMAQFVAFLHGMKDVTPEEPA